MNAGAIGCFSMAGIFLILAIIFLLFKEKASILISGFNNLTKAQREKYDKSKMCKDMRNLFFAFVVIFVIGGVLSYYIIAYFAIIAFIVFFVIFFKNVHLDIGKAFDKYKF